MRRECIPDWYRRYENLQKRAANLHFGNQWARIRSGGVGTSIKEKKVSKERVETMDKIPYNKMIACTRSLISVRCLLVLP